MSGQQDCRVKLFTYAYVLYLEKYYSCTYDVVYDVISIHAWCTNTDTKIWLIYGFYTIYGVEEEKRWVIAVVLLMKKYGVLGWAYYWPRVGLVVEI